MTQILLDQSSGVFVLLFCQSYKKALYHDKAVCRRVPGAAVEWRRDRDAVDDINIQSRRAGDGL